VKFECSESPSDDLQPGAPTNTMQRQNNATQIMLDLQVSRRSDTKMALVAGGK